MQTVLTCKKVKKILVLRWIPILLPLFILLGCGERKETGGERPGRTMGERQVVDSRQEVETSVRLGNAYLSEGNYVAAQKEFDRAISVAPDHAEALYGLGVVYSKQGNRGKAISSFENAIRLDPKLTAAYSNLGLMYLSGGRVDKATEICSKILKTDPDFAHGYFCLGLAYLTQNRYVDA
jgi:tetratricopeptide (TPR) repeat protein